MKRLSNFLYWGSIAVGLLSGAMFLWILVKEPTDHFGLVVTAVVEFGAIFNAYVIRGYRNDI